MRGKAGVPKVRPSAGYKVAGCMARDPEGLGVKEGPPEKNQIVTIRTWITHATRPPMKAFRISRFSNRVMAYLAIQLTQIQCRKAIPVYLVFFTLGTFKY